MADGEGSARTSLGLLRAGVSEAFGCGLALSFTFGPGEAIARGVVEGSCHTNNVDLASALGSPLPAAQKDSPRASSRLALDSGSRSDWDR